jgi:hypothetical protein
MQSNHRRMPMCFSLRCASLAEQSACCTLNAKSGVSTKAQAKAHWWRPCSQLIRVQGSLVCFLVATPTSKSILGQLKPCQASRSAWLPSAISRIRRLRHANLSQKQLDGLWKSHELAGRHGRLAGALSCATRRAAAGRSASVRGMNTALMGTKCSIGQFISI